MLKLQIENQERFFETQLHAERREKEALKLEAQEVQGQMLQQIRKQKEKNTSLLEILRWERLQASNRGRFYEVQHCLQAREREAIKMERDEIHLNSILEMRDAADELKRSLDHKDMHLQQQEEELFKLTLTHLPDCSTLPGSVNFACHEVEEHAFRAVSHIFLESMVSHRQHLGASTWCPPPEVVITSIEPSDAFQRISR